MNRLTWLLAPIAALALCGGCGGGGGGSGSGGGSSGGSAAGGSSGGSSLPYGGFVIFGQESIGGSPVYSGSAGFYTAASLGGCPGGTQQGSCCYESAAAAQAYGKTVPPADVSAGALSLQAGGATIATLPFTAGKGYAGASSATTTSFTWSAGATLGVTAAGDASGVGAFSGTVTAPASLAALSPAFGSLGAIPRASDFTVTWTPAGSGTVVLNLTAVNGTAGDGLVRCSAPSSGGSISVPAALLGNFASGDSAALQLTVENETTLNVANAAVGLTAESSLVGSATLN